MKKWIDSNGRLFGKLSIIDCVAILGLLLLCFGFYLKNHVLSATGGGTQDVGIQATLFMEILQDHEINALQVGDELFDYDHATGGPIGVITDIEILPPSAVVALGDGTYGEVTAESGNNVLMTIEGKGIYKDGLYTFNRVYNLGYNAYRNFYTKYVVFTGTVLDIHLTETPS